MDQVKGRFGQLVGHEVVTSHHDPITRERVEHAGVDIHREDPAGAPDALGKHPRHRASARADVQTVPPVADANLVQLSGGDRIVEPLEQPQPNPLHIGRARELKYIFGQPWSPDGK